jgi:hypothetical protein
MPADRLPMPAGRSWRAVEARATPSALTDAFVAATVMAYDLILVTRNTLHFEAVVIVPPSAATWARATRMKRIATKVRASKLFAKKLFARSRFEARIGV